MDRERLTELLQDPSQVAKQDLADLRSMTERFPWFSGAHLLQAVGEHETGDVLANDRRSTPAAFLPSRAVLFDLVRQEEQRQNAPLRVVKEESPLPTAMPPQDPAQGTKPVAALPLISVPETEMPEVENKADRPEMPKAPLEEEENTVAQPIHMDPGTATTTDKEQASPGTSASDILDLQIQEAILSTGYVLGRYEAPHAAATAKPEAVPAPPLQTPEAKAAMEEPAAHPPTTVEAAPVPAPRPITAATRLRFTDWLEQSDAGSPLAAPLALEETAGTFTPVEEAPAPPPAAASISPELRPQEILDQFIQRSSPLPVAAKAEFFNPQQAAKRSLQDDGLVSETLARIHEKQGNFAKAKEVYDRLAVKHPEKSVYFAALSKALEGRMHK